MAKRDGEFKTGDNKTYVSVTKAKNPEYIGKKVVCVKTDSNSNQHKTWISDSKGNMTRVDKWKDK